MSVLAGFCLCAVRHQIAILTSCHLASLRLSCWEPWCVVTACTICPCPPRSQGISSQLEEPAKCQGGSAACAMFISIGDACQQHITFTLECIFAASASTSCPSWRQSCLKTYSSGPAFGCRQVLFSNLPYTMGERDLRELAGTAKRGPKAVVGADVDRLPDRRSKGTGRVVFVDHSAAVAAVQVSHTSHRSGTGAGAGSGTGLRPTWLCHRYRALVLSSFMHG